MEWIWIIVGIFVGFFVHSLIHEDSGKCFGQIVFNDGDMKMLFEFSRNPDDIPKFERVYFDVRDIRKNITSSNGET